MTKPTRVAIPVHKPEQAYVYFNARVKKVRGQRGPSLAVLTQDEHPGRMLVLTRE